MKGQNKIIRPNDSVDMRGMLAGVEGSKDYRKVINLNCQYVLHPRDSRENFDFREAAMCAVALGKRRFALEVLGAYLEDMVVIPPKKRKWRFFRR